MKKIKTKGLSLFNKALLAVVIILFPLMVTFVISFLHTKDNIESHALNDLTIIAEAYEGIVYQFLEMNTRRAEDFASDGFIRQKLEAIVGDEYLAMSQLSSHLKNNKIVLDDHLESIVILNLNGQVVASVGKKDDIRDFSKEDFFIKGKVSSTVSESYEGSLEPRLAISTPITSKEDGELLGVLVNFILLDELSKLLSGEFSSELGAITHGTSKHQTMEGYVVNKDKFFITESLFVEDAELKLKNITIPVLACLDKGEEVVGIYSNYRGGKVAGSSMCLPHLKWTLLVEVDESEILDITDILLRDALIAALVVAFLLALLFIVFFRNVVRPVRGITRAAEALGGGDFDINIKVTTNDEIGVLAESFNRMATDISSSTSALKMSEASLVRAQKVANIGNWDWDILTGELYWSAEIYHIFDLNPTEFGATYDAFLKAVYPDDREMVVKAVNEAISKNTPYSVEHRVLRPDGSIRVVQEEGEVTFDEAGIAINMFGTVQDVTKAKEIEFEQIKLSSAIEQSQNIIFITDEDGVIEYVNPMFEQVSEYSAEDAVGQKPSILASGETSDEVYKELWSTIKNGKTWRGTFKNKKRGGAPFWVSGLVYPVINEREGKTNFVCLQEDISDKMQSDEIMKYMALHDDLTGLYNRSHFIEVVSEWIMKNRRGKVGVMLSLDIDQYQFIRDTHGHGVGDEFLKLTARHIESTLRKNSPPDADVGDTLISARLGGDDFGIFLPNFDEAGAKKIAEELIVGMRTKHLLDEAVSSTMTIGLAIYPEHGVLSEELIRKGDAAKIRAKELGMDRCYTFREDDNVLNTMHSRFHWRSRIIKSVEEDRFEPWFQPILDLKTNTVGHYEALSRLRDEDDTIILPGYYIDIAERFNLIAMIDKVMMEKTMCFQVEMAKSGKVRKFSINLSGKLLGDNEFLEFIKETIIRTGVDPSCLVFEITETAAVSDLRIAADFIEKLKAMGCLFSLDDFGVGFTSFLYLKELKVDFIKIDGSFIKNLDKDKKDRVFVKAMAEVARGLGIKTIAEWVTSEEIMNIVAELGIDYAQGYFIGKPSNILEK